jgi:CDP-diacylglycerol--glycerol-3-phosphate 3-phosphatidyltransferase
MKINIAEIRTRSNYLSILRLLLAIPLWFLFDDFSSQATRTTIFIICIFAAITDTLDGYLARKYNEITELGKIIDPLADKAVITAIVIKLFLIEEISAYYFFLIIGRDLVIFIGGIIISNLLGKVLPSNVIGKITVSFIGIVILLIILNIDRNFFLFNFFYYLSIALMIISLIAYGIRASEFIRRKKHESV